MAGGRLYRYGYRAGSDLQVHVDVLGLSSAQIERLDALFLKARRVNRELVSPGVDVELVRSDARRLRLMDRIRSGI